MTFTDWILANGEDLQVGIFFALLFTLAILERVVPQRRIAADRKVRWSTNLLLTFLNFLTFSIIPVSLLSAAYWAESSGWGLLTVARLPLIISVAVTLLVRAFISFYTHYFMHRVPLFWMVHRVHHLDTEMDVTTTVRFHPLEFIVGAAWGIPVVVAFGLTPCVLVSYEVLDVVVTLWTHSNVRLPASINRYLRYVIVTPDLHRIHHSAWQPETDSNFGAVFPIWDILFRTFRAEPKDGYENMTIGLDEVRGRDAHRPLWLLGSVARRYLVPRANHANEIPIQQEETVS